MAFTVKSFCFTADMNPMQAIQAAAPFTAVCISLFLDQQAETFSFDMPQKHAPRNCVAGIAHD